MLLMLRKFMPDAGSVYKLSALLLAMAWAGAGFASGLNSDRTLPGPISPFQVRYQLDLPGGGEIFPALTSCAAPHYWPIATLSMLNGSSQPIIEMVSAEIPGWSRKSVETVTLAPNEARTVQLSPELLPQAFQNDEIRTATVEVRAAIVGTTLGYYETRPVYLHSASDLFWGNQFVNAQYIARWVTPHDPAVLQLVSSARNYVPRGRLAGYLLPGSRSAPAVAAQVENEARGIFAAMEHLRISYVSSISTYGKFTTHAERVRLPHETLSLSSANCLDLSVAFAAAMENLGLEPVIVLVPGHAFVGVRLGHASAEILYLDLTVMPDGTFEAAERRASNWLQKTSRAQLNLIDIASARSRQIYPMAQNIAP